MFVQTEDGYTFLVAPVGGEIVIDDDDPPVVLEITFIDDDGMATITNNDGQNFSFRIAQRTDEFDEYFEADPVVETTHPPR